MAICDCCGRYAEEWRNITFPDVDDGCFVVCPECNMHMERLLNRLTLPENLLHWEVSWGKELLDKGKVSPQKRAPMSRVLGIQGTASAYGNRSSKPSAGNVPYAKPKYAPPSSASDPNGKSVHKRRYEEMFQDDAHEFGSPWTMIAKISCFCLVIGLMIAGGVVGNYLSWSSEAGGSILIGILVGLLIGLVVVSGQMILIRMADDIADSKRHLRTIKEMLIQFFDEQ